MVHELPLGISCRHPRRSTHGGETRRSIDRNCSPRSTRHALVAFFPPPPGRVVVQVLLVPLQRIGGPKVGSVLGWLLAVVSTMASALLGLGLFAVAVP
jgi:hypothetical protein